MGEYLKIIIAIPVVTGLISMILPSGKLKKQTRLVVSLVALLAVLLPLRRLAAELGDGLSLPLPNESDTPAFSAEDTAGAQMIVDETCRLICGQLETRLGELYGIEGTKIELICDTSDYENVVILQAILYVDSDEDGDYRALCDKAARYVGETLGCRCALEYT